MTRELLEPILDNGIKNPHYFNGRWLTAETLRSEQEAQRTHHLQLGRAIGDGVVEGLMVTPEVTGAGGGVPRLAVTPGLAFNREGQALVLPDGEEVVLAREAGDLPDQDGAFTPCALPPGVSVLEDPGAYLFVMSPASGLSEQAPGRQLGDDRALTGCGSRYAVEGVQFRLVKVAIDSLTGMSQATRDEIESVLDAEDLASQSLLRNHLAHLFFGTEKLLGQLHNPLFRENETDPARTWGALEDLRALELVADCDVPLALVFWTLSGLTFVDSWAVRRRPRQRLSHELAMTAPSDRRQAEMEAVFFQFQDHLDALAAEGTAQGLDLHTVEARAYFRYLPPLGIFPHGGGAIGSDDGYDVDALLHGMGSDDFLRVSHGRLTGLLHRSWWHLPVRIPLPQDPDVEDLFQAIVIAENLDAVGSGNAEQFYMAFIHRKLSDDLEVYEA